MKFLYYHITELWGRRERAKARNGETGASRIGDELEKPLVNLKL